MMAATQMDLFDGRRKRRNPKVRTSEHQHQVALMQWARLQEGRVPELALLHAIPNGGFRHINVALGMRAEGVKPGVPDLHLPVPRGQYAGLWIELKAERGKASPAQAWWIDQLRRQGHCACICYGHDEARKVILDYLGGKPWPSVGG